MLSTRRRSSHSDSTHRRFRNTRLALEPLETRMLMAGNILDTSFDGDGKVFAPVNTYTTSTRTAKAVYGQEDGTTTNGVKNVNLVVAGTVEGLSTTTQTTVKGKVTTTTVTDKGDFGLMRFRPNGTLDTSFGDRNPAFPNDPAIRLGKTQLDFGRSVGDTVAGMAVDSQGRFVLVGEGPRLATNFNTVVRGKTVTSTYYTNTIGVARFSANGELDLSFGTNGKFVFAFSPDVKADSSSFAQSVVVQAGATPAQDKILIAAWHSAGTTTGGQVFAIARLDSNGRLDGSFGTHGRTTTNIGPSDDRPEDLALQTVTVDGKTKTYAVVAGLAYSTVDDYTGPGTTNGALARYTLDDQVLPGDPAPGSLDGSFGTGGIVQVNGGASLNYYFREIAVQANGSIIVTNAFEEEGLGGQSYLALARFSPTGLLDPTFGPGIATTIIGDAPRDYSHEYNAFDLILDGNKILLSGNLYTFTPSVSTQSFVARFMNDGTPDPSFGVGGSGSVFFNMNDKPTTSDEFVRAMTIQPDGKIVVVGGIYSGTTSPSSWAIVRLTADDPAPLPVEDDSEPTSYDLALMYLLSDPELLSETDRLTAEPA